VLREAGDAVDAPPEAASDGAAAGPDRLREESARFMPRPYDLLWIGQPLDDVLADYPQARPFDARSDPERLEWHELTGANGLLVRVGFAPARDDAEQPLRSAQFLSLLAAPAPARAAPTPTTIEAWRVWFEELYQPLIDALRERYGETAEVYSCGGTGAHPVVRIVWRGRLLALTAAFLLHDKGLSSTLIVTTNSVTDRYLRATQCRFMQDRLL
jgi:hypothetical protein